MPGWSIADNGEWKVAEQREHSREHTRVLIVGSGPAGYTAAIYAARAGLEPIVVAGLQFGGQLMITTEVENFPGYPDGVTGPALMEDLQKQAERFGTRIVLEDATRIELGSRQFAVETEEKRCSAAALIIATGASARWLGIGSEQRLVNRGVSACATCDGALYRGKAIAVVGGGDTAMEEALFLTRFASRVTVVHRRDALRASRIMQERATAHEKIDFAWNSVVEEVLGDDVVTGVRLRDVQTGKRKDLGVEGLFISICHQPNTQRLDGQLYLTAEGHLAGQTASQRTSATGVSACGDVAAPSYRQAVTAAGTGCMAAIEAERWLAEEGLD